MARARKSLREARALTLISGAFVVTGCWAVTVGAVVLGVVTITFFSAGLLLGIMWWRDERPGRRSHGHKGEVAAMAIASALLGLACLAVAVVGIAAWGEVAAAVALRFPRVVVVVAGAVGAVFFLGGAVVILVRGLR